MRKSWVRLTLVSASAFVVFGQAAAQTSVQYWFNSFGDTATNQPAVINVTSGSTAKLTVYLKTAGGIGPLSGINVLFGYSTATSTGSSATPANTNATFNSFSWGQSDLTSSQAFAGQGGGGGPAGGTSRPYGLFASTFTLGTFSGTGDGVNFKVMDVTLNINAAPGTDIPISIWSFGSTDNYASAVVNSNSAEFFPSQPYTATLHVAGVPEPTTMAALGLGAIAMIRRRRRSK
jgi:hypothetical protein